LSSLHIDATVVIFSTEFRILKAYQQYSLKTYMQFTMLVVNSFSVSPISELLCCTLYLKSTRDPGKTKQKILKELLNSKHSCKQ